MTDPTEKTVSASELVHPNNDGFRERVTPKKMDAENKLLMYECTCKSIHFRHAGYCNVMLPFLKPGGEKRVALEEYRVMVCVACKKSYVWANEQMWDVSDKIDLKAWAKTEAEAHEATGPGGQC